ncbi:P22 phage major capsid protein family protein [Kitasatospora sp. NPDC088134]|uniref:P22 phage major capsid protein family protein n=1 Tax=Kitasatospora sp. NPDC088134 TaxID=3364071 RepID=UPI00382280FB
MANTFGAESPVAAVGVALLKQLGVLAPLVYRDAEKDFGGRSGTTVSIPVPHAIPAADFDGVNKFSAAGEDLVELKITASPYSAVPITDEENTFTLMNYATQVLAPQVDGVARALEAVVAKPMNALIAAVKDTDTAQVIDPARALDFVADASVMLDQRDVPDEGRYLVIAPEIKAFFLKDEGLRQADKAGGTDGLRRGQIADVHGFKVIASNQIKGGAVAFVREAFALAVRAPRAMEGAAWSQAEVQDGYALTVTRDFDLSSHSDVSLVKSFGGAKLVDASRAVAFKLKAF